MGIWFLTKISLLCVAIGLFHAEIREAGKGKKDVTGLFVIFHLHLRKIILDVVSVEIVEHFGGDASLAL